MIYRFRKHYFSLVSTTRARAWVLFLSRVAKFFAQIFMGPNKNTRLKKHDAYARHKREGKKGKRCVFALDLCAVRRVVIGGGTPICKEK